MNSQQRFTELWTDYLEGELEESSLEELNSLLSAEPALLEQATDLYQTHRLLSLLGGRERKGPQEDFVLSLLGRLPEESELFTQSVMSQLELPSAEADLCHRLITPAERLASSADKPLRQRLRVSGGWLVALLCVLAMPFVWYFAPATTTPPASVQSTPATVPGDAPAGTNPAPVNSIENRAVRFANLAHARFFGELTPRPQNALPLHREYILMSGLAELVFPRGATAIIEGPAVFRVLTEDCLSMDVGRCSVHAPEGAEGFRVETPVTKVVDRGTRFTVQVTETNETEVQVIEGMADIYRLEEPALLSPPSRLPSLQREGQKSDVQPSTEEFALRLNHREARRILNESEFVAEQTPFNPAVYRHRLPDRIISYEATAAPTGGVEQLVSVTVQRGGQPIRYSLAELIPVEVTAFKAEEGINRNGHILGGPVLPESRIAPLSDGMLNTGVINPGGSQQPLTSNPVMNLTGEKAVLNTPGMAIHFATPVKNGPGPDIVFFEVQPISSPPDGDPFHVSPLTFSAGRKSHTIRQYDLSLNSPEALRVTNFYLYQFKQSISSLTELLTVPSQPRHIALDFRAVAVGIDLSDLGYGPEEQAEGLFLQDVLDDINLVDPVFIGGLP